MDSVESILTGRDWPKRKQPSNNWERQTSYNWHGEGWVFTSSQDSCASHILETLVPELPAGRQGRKIPHTVITEQFLDRHMRLNVYKPVGPDDMHPRVLRKLVDVAKPLSIMYENCVPGYWKKGNIISIFKKKWKEDLKNYRQLRLTSMLGKMEQILLEDMSRHMRNLRQLAQLQQGRSWLTVLVIFYDGVTTWVDKGKATDDIYLDLCKVFDMVSHDIGK